MKLSVIIPTTKDRNCGPLVIELLRQLADEIIVVQFGSSITELSVGQNNRLRYLTTNYSRVGVQSLGNHERNAGIDAATGTHLAFLDDDDAIDPNYVSIIKANADNDCLNLFRINHEVGLIWRDPVIRLANVSTQMIVIPNQFPPKWTANIYASDLPFIEDCAAQFETKWHEQIIATHNGGRK